MTINLLQRTGSDYDRVRNEKQKIDQEGDISCVCHLVIDVFKDGIEFCKQTPSCYTTFFPQRDYCTDYIQQVTADFDAALFSFMLHVSISEFKTFYTAINNTNSNYNHLSASKDAIEIEKSTYIRSSNL